MPTSHRPTRTSRRTARSLLQRSVESLEPRVLLSGTSYVIGVDSLTGGGDGAGPFAGLVADANGNLFGTTTAGGANSDGAIVEIPANGNTAVPLYNFAGTPDGAAPYAQLTIDSSGDLFGTTYSGGVNNDGTVFEIPAGLTTPSILYSFAGTDGANPYASVIIDGAGNLFGTTVNGGLHDDGTIFEITAGGTFISLHSFAAGPADGSTPFSPLVLDHSGNLFGTTYAGGANTDGTVFEISSTGFYSLVHSFNGTDGAKPTDQLVVDAANNLYGNTSAGGANGDGTLFEIPDNGSLATGYSFTGAADGESPFAPLSFDQSGNLFGTTYKGGAHANGTVFEIPSAELLANSLIPVTLHAFTGGSDGATPYGQILTTPSGDLYGTTTGGGTGHGVIFQLVPTNTARLTISKQPTDLQAGKTMPPVVVHLELANANTNVNDNSSVTLSIVSGPAGGAIAGLTTVQALGGVATFASLRFTHAGTYTLQATDGTLDSVLLTDFTITAGPPAKLVFVQNPVGLVAGQTLAPITVDVEDALGNVTTDNSSVTLKLLSTPAGAPLDGTLTVQAVNGVATFSDLSVTKTGSFSLSASDVHLTVGTSAKFTVTPDIASSQLVVSLPPANPSVIGKPLAPNLVVKVEDQFGNLITSDHSSATITIAGGPSQSTLTGVSTINDTGGVFTFKNLSLSMVGNYTLQVTDNSLSATTLAVPLAQTIAQGATSIAKLPNSTHTFDQTFSLSASFKSTAPASLPFTGIASLTDANHDLLGTVTLTNAGLAKFTLADLAPGTYLCTVTYPGDIDHSAATSNTFTLLVNHASTTTTLTTSSSTLVFGQSLTLTATVKSTTAPNTPPTGNIEFFDGNTLLDAVPLTGNAASLTLTPATLGHHAYKAVYVLGDLNFKSSSSPVAARTVTPDKTAITLTSSLPTPIALNQSFNLTIHVSLLAPGTATLTGDSVTIKDHGKLLNTVTLDINGDATLPGLTFTSPGTQLLTALYSPNPDTLTSTSTPLKLTIT